MPLNGPGPLSQAVILTLLHRVCVIQSLLPAWGLTYLFLARQHYRRDTACRRGFQVCTVVAPEGVHCFEHQRTPLLTCFDVQPSERALQEPLISPYIARVVPNVKAVLNTTKQCLAILPGGPQLMDSAKTITEIQDILVRKQV